MSIPLDALTATGLLDRAGSLVAARRSVELEDLRVCAQWAALHSTDPRRDPESGGRVWAEDRLVQLGGDGTPGVQEFCVAELAMARQVHPASCVSALGDILDLQHRLPRVYAVVEALGCEAWVARKVARLTRSLPADRVEIVDIAVSRAIAGESPGRVIAICEAKVIEADPATHAAKVEAERHRRYVALSKTDATGLRHVIARVNAGDAVWVDAILDRVADLITDQHSQTTSRGELRSIAFGWLARPAELLQLLLGGDVETTETSGATAFPAELLEALRSIDPSKLRPRVILYVHLSQAAVEGTAAAVARVESVGPLLADHHLFAGCTVTVKPVVDLNDRIDANCYEHPVQLRERRLLATPGDTFPFAVGLPGLSGRVDLDHSTPYDPNGPPGQTGLHNSGPLGRRHHRWKTHAGYTSRQCGTSRWAWRTRHDHYYLVDHTGTHRLDTEEGRMVFGAPPGVDLYFAELVYEPAGARIA